MNCILKIFNRKRTIGVSDQGLTLNYPDQKFYEWGEITNIFSFITRSRLIVIDKAGVVSTGMVYADETFDTLKKKLNFIYRTWEEQAEAKVQPEIYEYSNWYKEEERPTKKEIFLEFFGSLAIIFITIMAFLEMKKDKEMFSFIDYLGFIFLPFLSLNGIFLGIYHLNKLKQKIIDSVEFNECFLQVNYEDGTNRICDCGAKQMTDTWREVIMPTITRSVHYGKVSKVQQRF